MHPLPPPPSPVRFSQRLLVAQDLGLLASLAVSLLAAACLPHVPTGSWQRHSLLAAQHLLLPLAYSSRDLQAAWQHGRLCRQPSLVAHAWSACSRRLSGGDGGRGVDGLRG
jgi:hypothetical protein